MIVAKSLSVSHAIYRVHLQELEDRYIEGELDACPEVLPEDLSSDICESGLLGVRQLLRPDHVEAFLARDVLYQPLDLRSSQGELGLPARRDDHQILVLLPEGLE